MADSGDGERDWGIFRELQNDVLERDKANVEGSASKERDGEGCESQILWDGVDLRRWLAEHFAHV